MFSPTHPFLPHVAAHFFPTSHLFLLVFQALPRRWRLWDDTPLRLPRRPHLAARQLVRRHLHSLPRPLLVSVYPRSFPIRHNRHAFFPTHTERHFCVISFAYPTAYLTPYFTLYLTPHLACIPHCTFHFIYLTPYLTFIPHSRFHVYTSLHISLYIPHSTSHFIYLTPDFTLYLGSAFACQVR